MDTSTVYESGRDQEVFRHGGVETLRECGQTATYGTVEDGARRTVYSEQG